MKSHGEVRVLVDGAQSGTPVHLAAGDSLLVTMPGELTVGSVTVAEKRIAALIESLALMDGQAKGLERTIRMMANAADLDAAIGIAYRAGHLRDDDE